MLGFIDDTTRCWSPGEDALDEGRSGDAYAPPPIAPLLTLTTMPTPACAHAASSLARDASRVCPDAAALLPLRSHSPAGRGRLLVSRTLAWASCRAQGARRFGDRQVRRADKSPHSRAQPRTARTAAHSRAPRLARRLSLPSARRVARRHVARAAAAKPGPGAPIHPCRASACCRSGFCGARGGVVGVVGEVH